MKQSTILICNLTMVFVLFFAVEGINAQEIGQLKQGISSKDATSGLSGKVVDTDGKPISGLRLSIQSMQIKNGNLQPHVRVAIRRPIVKQPNNQLPLVQQAGPQSTVTVKSEGDGSFKATNIRPGFIQIRAIPQPIGEIGEKQPENAPIVNPEPRHLMFGREADIRLVSIKLNKLTFFYPEDSHGPFENLTFGLKPNVNLEDVIITVEKRMKIMAKVVFANGKPVANAEIYLDMEVRAGEFGSRGGGYGTNNFTNAEGYFVEYRDNPGYYTISVEHKGYKGGAGPFVLTKDKHPENLVIKLDGSPVEKKQPKEINKELDKEKARDLVKGLLGKRNAPPPIIRPAVPQKPEKIVWIINPANGHAYARINCRDWYDAQQKAIQEGAHLVSINNEEEQFWVEVLFSGSFWIGLNDVEKEGEWRWDSGEPVTYTNWVAFRSFPDNSPETERDLVAMTFFEGGWQAAAPNSHTARTTHFAVIEKDGLISKVPKPEDTEDE